MSEGASASLRERLAQILARIQAGDCDAAVESIGFAITDDLEDFIEEGGLQDRRSGQATTPATITREQVVIARRFIPRLRAVAQRLQRAGPSNVAVAEVERLILEWNF